MSRQEVQSFGVVWLRASEIKFSLIILHYINTLLYFSDHFDTNFLVNVVAVTATKLLQLKELNRVYVQLVIFKIMKKGLFS